MQIVGFNIDDKTSNGTAKISWLMKDLLNVQHRMNATNTNENGWPATEMRTWLRNTILPTINSSIRSHIVDVNKTYYDYTNKTTLVSSDNIWIPSAREMLGNSSSAAASKIWEGSGIKYTSFFVDDSARLKKRNKQRNFYWLRSATYGDNDFHVIGTTGTNASYGTSTTELGVCVGFCTD